MRSSDPWDILRNLTMGRRIRLRRNGEILAEGTLVPSHELSGDRIVQVKLASGYNVGVRVEAADSLEILEPEPTQSPQALPAQGAALGSRAPASSEPWVALLTTGGTIASRVDYQTGGVRPVNDESEILSFYPDLGREGPVRILPIFDRLSENIAPKDWETIAERVVEVFREGARGVVIAHGTDTLGFTAAALSFLLEDLTGPVVVVGAQRSPDRPSSDGASNLHAAVRVARHPELAEVVVVMHAGVSDDRFAIHRATRVRKMHSSRRDAFQSRNGPPIGWIQNGTCQFFETFHTRAAGPTRFAGPLDPSAALLWSYPGLDPERARALVAGLRGVVIAGTGLGHTATAHLEWIRESVAHGTVIVMTTQCLEGNADPYVYATGRELFRAGVLYVADLLPETAYVKLLWALGQSRDPETIRRLMLKDRAGEFELRHLPGEHP